MISNAVVHSVGEGTRTYQAAQMLAPATRVSPLVEVAQQQDEADKRGDEAASP